MDTNHSVRYQVYMKSETLEVRFADEYLQKCGSSRDMIKVGGEAPTLIDARFTSKEDRNNA
uniref:Uncharacterized protein n=1 Tax=Moniliophthora roreri TaxID=221103 RepID=A0A0W0GEB2_MONRR